MLFLTPSIVWFALSYASLHGKQRKRLIDTFRTVWMCIAFVEFLAPLPKSWFARSLKSHTRYSFFHFPPHFSLYPRKIPKLSRLWICFWAVGIPFWLCYLPWQEIVWSTPSFQKEFWVPGSFSHVSFCTAIAPFLFQVYYGQNTMLSLHMAKMKQAVLRVTKVLLFHLSLLGLVAPLHHWFWVGPVLKCHV